MGIVKNVKNFCINISNRRIIQIARMNNLNNSNNPKSGMDILENKICIQ